MKPFFYFFNLSIESYPLFLGLAWALGINLTHKLFLKYQSLPKHFVQYYLGLFISSWIGAKLLFWFTLSQRTFLTSYFKNPNFWLGGGFVFYGGFIGGLLFSFLFHKVYKSEMGFAQMALMTPGLTFAQAIGRIGCFLSGCCYGKPTASSLSYSLHGELRHPVQIYESLILIITGIILLQLLKKKNFKKVFYLFLAIHSVSRFILEYLRGDSLRGLYSLGLSTSQWIAIGLLITLLFLILIENKRGPSNVSTKLL